MSDYITRAQHFIREFAKYCIGCEDVWSFQLALTNYRRDHPHRVIKFDYGASRVTFITSDYVIKLDYYGDKDCGDCFSEMDGYEAACEAGFEKYFAKITPYYYGMWFFIMPRIYNIHARDPYNAPYYITSRRARSWISEHFYDLHSGNYGFNKEGQVIIFDYAGFVRDE